MDFNPLISYATSQQTKDLINFVKNNKIISGLIDKTFGESTDKIKKSFRDKEIEKILESYLEKCFEVNMFMNTIAFKNSRKIIYDLYIPITVITDRISSEIELYKVENRIPEFIEKYERILVVDNAGMGKSTLTKYLLLQTIVEKFAIPILIELRNLNKDTNIIEYIRDQINTINKSLELEDLQNVLVNKGFIFFFDGYDEISDIDKEGVTKMLQDFIDKVDGKYVITSREDNSLNCFGDFAKFQIKPLNRKEAFGLIEKYDNYGDISKRLIHELINDNLEISDEFLSNPLMISLLYTTYRYIPNIPIKKVEFYEQVYNALYEEHDFSKRGAYKREKKSQLSKMDFKRILNALGFLSVKSNKISFKEDELFNMIKESLKLNNNTITKADNILDDIIKAVPFFIREESHIRWIHKSFCEYFAANFIAYDLDRKVKERLIEQIIHCNNTKYINMLEFYYDLDKKGTRRLVLYKILNDYIEYYNKVYQSNIFKDYDPKLLDARKSCDFTGDLLLIYSVYDLFELDKEVHKNAFYYIRDIANFSIDDSFKVSVHSEFWIVKRINIESRIIKILYDKGIDIFNYKIITSVFRSFDTSVTETFRLFKYPNLLKHVVNDDPKNILNSADYFENITNSIIYVSDYHDILDYDKCLKLKKDIEDEIRAEDELTLLI